MNEVVHDLQNNIPTQLILVLFTDAASAAQVIQY
jgi:hypothetical protein